MSSTLIICTSSRLDDSDLEQVEAWVEHIKSRRKGSNIRKRNVRKMIRPTGKGRR